MDSDKNLGPTYLREWRLFRGMSQEDLAEKVGTSPNMIQYLETGERGLNAKWQRRLAPILRITPGMILDCDPANYDFDVVELLISGNERARRQLSEIAKTLSKADNHL